MACAPSATTSAAGERGSPQRSRTVHQRGSNSLDTLRDHAGAITGGAAKVSGGVANVGISAFGVVTFVLSVTFLTLFGLIELPCTRSAVGALLYRDKRERVEQVTDRIITTTSRYMLGNLAISAICATVYGTTAVILGLHALALALIAGILDLIPNVGRSSPASSSASSRCRSALEPWSPS